MSILATIAAGGRLAQSVGKRAARTTTRRLVETGGRMPSPWTRLTAATAARGSSVAMPGRMSNARETGMPAGRPGWLTYAAAPARFSPSATGVGGGSM